MVEFFELTLIERSALRAFGDAETLQAFAAFEPALSSLESRGLVKMEYLHVLPSKKLTPVYLLTHAGSRLLARISSPGIQTIGLNLGLK